MKTLLTASLVTFVLFAGACAPQTRPGEATAGQSGQQSSQSQRSKTVIIGIQSEPADFFGLGGSGKSGGTKSVETMAVDRLVVLNDRGEYQAQLAVERISVDTGSLRVNADSTMDAIWTIRT